MSDTITHSSGQKWKNCPEEYRLAKVECLEIKDRPPAHNLNFGTVWHHALERYHYDNFTEGAILDYLRDEALVSKEDNRAHLMAMFIVYCKQHQNLKGWDEFVSAEEEFLEPILHPVTGEEHEYKQGGKIDGLVRIDDKYYLFENKTAANPTGDYCRRINLDRQVHQYGHYLGVKRGIHIEGVLYNVAPKNLRWTRRNKGGHEAFGDYVRRLVVNYGERQFLRFYVPFNPITMADVVGETWTIAEGIRRMKSEGSWFKDTQRCFDWGRRCQFWDICETGGRKDVMGMYVKVDAHQELSIV